MNERQGLIDAVEQWIAIKPELTPESRQNLRDFAVCVRPVRSFELDMTALVCEEEPAGQSEELIDPRELTALSTEVHQLPVSFYSPGAAFEATGNVNRHLGLFNHLQQLLFATTEAQDTQVYSGPELAAYLQRAHPEFYAVLSDDNQRALDYVGNSLAKRLGKLRTQRLLPPERRHELRDARVWNPTIKTVTTFYTFRRPGMVTTTGSAPAAAVSEKEVCQASPQ